MMKARLHLCYISIVSQMCLAFQVNHSNQRIQEREGLKRKILIGSPEQVKAQLEELSVIYDMDEFLIVTMGPDYESRLQSYKLLAQ
jgi:alkanesulfonate monooxygenase SsuD/methylene tetrahydromethanopterin reductase-like flavin-dependent oxidoreductase (luciferase family)